MSRQTVRVGVTVNDKQGDAGRVGIQKVNLNFLEIYEFLTGTTNGVLLPNALPVSRGGTGASDAVNARRALGISDLATKSVGSLEGDVVVVGFMGLGTDYAPNTVIGSSLAPDVFKSGSLNYMSDSNTTSITLASRDVNDKSQLGVRGFGKDAEPVFRSATAQGFTPWFSMYNESNCAVTVNGLLRKSQNSVRLNPTFVTARKPIADLQMNHNGLGLYSITGIELSDIDWTIEVPMDYKGNTEFDVSVQQSGTVVNVTVTKDGNAFDIPPGKGIDLNVK